MRSGKFSDHERSTASYLLRAFSRRIACESGGSTRRQEPEDGGVWQVACSFADVAGQCQAAECVKSEETHRRVIK